MQYVFGAGKMWGRPAASLPPVCFGAVQGVSIDFAFTEIARYGRNVFPLLLGRGQGKLTGRAQFAAINARLFSDIVMGGNAPTTGVLRTVVDEAHTVTGNMITATHGANFAADFGIVQASNRDIYERVLTLPTERQYVCNESTGVYAFSTEAENRPVLVSYTWADASSGQQVQLTNQLQAAPPLFAMVLSETFQGKALTIVLNACASTELTSDSRLEDFAISSLTFEAIADANGVLGSISLDESDSDFWICSATYPIAYVESFNTSATMVKGFSMVPPQDQFNLSAVFSVGTLSNGLRTYADGLAETFNVSATWPDGNLANGLRFYANGVVEQFNVSASFTGGDLEQGLVLYTNGLAEQFNVSASFTGGTIT